MQDYVWSSRLVFVYQTPRLHVGNVHSTNKLLSGFSCAPCTIAAVTAQASSGVREECEGLSNKNKIRGRTKNVNTHTKKVYNSTTCMTGVTTWHIPVQHRMNGGCCMGPPAPWLLCLFCTYYWFNYVYHLFWHTKNLHFAHAVFVWFVW